MPWPLEMYTHRWTYYAYQQWLANLVCSSLITDNLCWKGHYDVQKKEVEVSDQNHMQEVAQNVLVNKYCIAHLSHVKSPTFFEGIRLHDLSCYSCNFSHILTLPHYS